MQYRYATKIHHTDMHIKICKKISCEGQRNNCIQHLPTQYGRAFLRIIYLYRTAGPFFASSTHTGRQGLSNICPHMSTQDDRALLPNIYPYGKNDIGCWGSMLGYFGLQASK